MEVPPEVLVHQNVGCLCQLATLEIPLEVVLALQIHLLSMLLVASLARHMDLGLQEEVLVVESEHSVATKLDPRVVLEQEAVHTDSYHSLGSP